MKEIFNNTVKGKEEDKILSDLFRQKLENSEIRPSPSFGIKLMRKVGIKEFFSFNPLHFNIWYAGGIVAAGTLLTLAIESHQPKHEKSLPGNAIENITVPKKIIRKDTLQGVPIVNNSKQKLQKATSQGMDVSQKKSAIINVNGPGRVTNSVSQNIPIPSTIISPVVGRKLFGNSAPGLNEIKVHVDSVADPIVTSLNEGCAPLKVSFKNIAVSYDSCLWKFGDGGYSDEKNPVWMFDVPGEYNVTLNIYGPEGVQRASVVTIVVHGGPIARFEFTPEDAKLPGDEIVFHNYSSDADRYRWDFGDGNSSEMFEPRYTYAKQGHYNVKLVAISEFGCSDSVVIKNAFSGSDYYINFPNAFLPNTNGPSNGYYTQKSDEEEQVFHPIASGVDEYQLRIFSRSGILIFESNDINIGWDGYFKGQLSETGVYIWKVRGNYINGEPFTKMGDVTLLKK